MKSPVVFFIFNRPKTTELVFAEIAKAKPPNLLVVGDGPRQERPGEDALCAAARKVIERVDWNCEVRTNYAEKNMGCGRRVSSGIDWAFGNALAWRSGGSRTSTTTAVRSLASTLRSPFASICVTPPSARHTGMPSW